MEISGKVLREVEFRDRLRGYDTDEVDEFLEKVAVGIDDLRAELVRAHERAERAERTGPPPVAASAPAPAPVVGDDDPIRRTLVLAQRTADLAISEAREEATQLIDEARTQSETVLSQAQEAARRLRDEADQEATQRLGQLADQRERLEREIQSLAHLLDGERERLTQALESALQYVGQTLSSSDELSAYTSSTPSGGEPPVDEAPTYSAEPMIQPEPEPEPEPEPYVERDSILPDIEAEISEDAATAYAGEPPPASAFQREPDRTARVSDPTDVFDPDEALWERWAQGAGLGPSDPEDQ